MIVGGCGAYGESILVIVGGCDGEDDSESVMVRMIVGGYIQEGYEC